MTVYDIPQELVDMLNADVGHEHKRQGRVLASFARLLTRWEQIRHQYPHLIGGTHA